MEKNRLEAFSDGVIAIIITITITITIIKNLYSPSYNWKKQR